ncbi:hypothetical protein TWF694_008100 [Orbilia ellipsospora]|uniref:Protein kinase domain-containing protein n=1 Tax=Orbilia ellipsospora TaxID=2528407 RepID=A0AAV9XLR5_9PEZI
MITFRVQNIPLNWSWQDLKAAISTLCDSEISSPSITGTLLRAADPSLKSQVALIRFSEITPDLLKPVADDETRETIKYANYHGTYLQFDTNFRGMTPLFCPSEDEDISLDIVAVTGLGGHPYASWASRDVDVFWLRDFLGDDIPKCRVLTFGYNTTLSIDSNYRFEDFSKELLSDLARVRSSKTALSRPLVLMGHSYGARLITQVIHRGMDASDIERYITHKLPSTSARHKIVQGLRADNEEALNGLQNFIDLLPRFLVVSVYERVLSKKLIPVGSNENSGHELKTGPWKRIGEPYTPVTESSAVLGLPANFEITIPSDLNHSNIAKISHRGPVYQELLKHLKKIEVETSQNAFLFTKLLPIDPRERWDLNLNPLLQKYQQTVTTAATDDTLIHPTSTLIRVATHIIEDLCSKINFAANDSSLLKGAVLNMRIAQYHLGLLDKTISDVEKGANNLRETRTMILKLRSSLMDLIHLLDRIFYSFATYSTRPGQQQASLPTAINEQLESLVVALGQQSELLGSLLEAPTSSSSSSSSPLIPYMKGEILARMATSQDYSNWDQGNTITWLSFDRLFFPAESLSETTRDSDDWIQKVVQIFKTWGAEKLKLRARRFGVLDYNGHLQKVMVEFRPYPANIKPSSREMEDSGFATEGDKDYRLRKWAVVQLARMLLSTSKNSQSPLSRFPSVPFLYLADMSASSPPSFALIYSAEGLYSLQELIQGDGTPPSVAQRILLVLSYAQALAALHIANMVHGGFSTDNLYLRFPQAGGFEKPNLKRSIAEGEALLAGFETARSFGGMTDSLDIEDPDLRVYVHPERLSQGSEKPRQQPSYDVFGLGMVMVEIGMWKLLRSLPQYPGPSETDKTRQRFCRSQRTNFREETTPKNLGGLYADIIAFCLEKGSDPLMEGYTRRPELSDDDSFGSWKTLRVVELIQECARQTGALG